MLTANCCVSLRSGWGTYAQLEVYALSLFVVFNGDFICCVSVFQLVLVCPGYDLKLPTPSGGANDLCCWSVVKLPITHFCDLWRRRADKLLAYRKESGWKSATPLRPLRVLGLSLPFFLPVCCLGAFVNCSQRSGLDRLRSMAKWRHCVSTTTDRRCLHTAVCLTLQKAQSFHIGSVDSRETVVTYDLA